MKKMVKSLLIMVALILLSTMTVMAEEEKVTCQIRSLNENRTRSGEIFNIEEWETLVLVNKERMSRGLAPLTATAELQYACDVRAEEIIQLFEHARPDGTDCFTVLEEYNVPYMTAGENIAAGQESPAEVVNAWMNSPGHRGNILDEEFAHVGTGCSWGGYYGYHWVQLFTGHYNSCYPGGELAFDGTLVIPAGTDVEELMLVAELPTYENEVFYLPLSSEFFKGLNTNRMGEQEVEVSFLGYTGTLDVYVDFADIKETDYFYDSVYWAVENGIAAGTSSITFSPNAGCTRAQAVAFLWRAAGCPEPEASSMPFTDVKEGAYYHKAVLWAVEKGVTAGTSPTTFSPDAVCTRGQIVSFLWRNFEKPVPASGECPFKDVRSSDYYYDPVLWAVENGITAGTTPTTFSPSDACTRGQIVSFLYRALAK